MPPERLALLRMLVGGYAVHYVWTRRGLLDRLAETSHDLYAPVGLARIFGEPIGTGTFSTLVALTLALGIAFIAGLGFRWSGPLFAVALLFVLSYRNSWSMVYHTTNLTVLHALALGLVPSADALSADAWIARRWRPAWMRFVAWTAPAPGPASRYGWPVRLMCALTSITYLLGGVAKLAGPMGLSWATGSALGSYLTRDGLRKEILEDGAPALTFALYDKTALLAVVALLTLALEIGAPLVLFNRTAARIWSVLTWGMHWGIYLVMDIVFTYHLTGIALAPFFPLERILKPWRRGLGSGTGT